MRCKTRGGGEGFWRAVVGLVSCLVGGQTGEDSSMRWRGLWAGLWGVLIGARYVSFGVRASAARGAS